MSATVTSEPALAERRGLEIGTGVRERPYLALWICLAWLGGSYLLFLASPFSGYASNLWLVSLYVLGVLVAFAAGYVLCIRLPRHYRVVVNRGMPMPTGYVVVLILGALWFLVFGIASLVHFGAISLEDVVDGVLHPGRAYQDKLELFQRPTVEALSTIALQATTWSGALFALFVPYLCFFWRGIGWVLRSFAIVSIIVYVVSFLYIGTLKGIGDLLILGLASFVALSGLRGPPAPQRPSLHRRNQRYWAIAIVAIAMVVFVVVASFILGDRYEGRTRATYFSISPVLSGLFGDRFGMGLTTLWFYPTNGYIGLSQQLQESFVFSGGASMPVFAHLTGPVFGIADPMTLSFPMRNEALTGWSSTITWSTIYPWLASDLTFIGALFVMGLLGWLIARSWLGVRRERDPLALALLALLMIAVAYAPANNQLMVAQYSAVGLVTLLVLYGSRTVAAALSPDGRSRAVLRREQRFGS